MIGDNMKSIYEMSIPYFHTNKDTPDDRRKAKGSFHLISWVIAHSSLYGSSKLIAATVAYHYNTDRGISFPSMETIRKRTGYNKRTIEKGIREMEESGEWILSKDSASVSKRIYNIYTPLSPEKTDIMAGLLWESSRMTDEYRVILNKRKSSRLQQAENYQRRISAANERIPEELRPDYSIKSLKQITGLNEALIDMGDWNLDE